jgi:FMN reductase
MWFGQADRPIVLGFGGTLRAGSSTERALLASLAEAERAGAATELITARDLELPLYAPERPERSPATVRFLDAVRRADGLIIASPGYHAGPSGLIKNALDYIEDLRDDERPYLHGRAVGCIACASGWRAAETTLMALRVTIHALRGWPTPLGAAINSALGVFDGMAVTDLATAKQLSEIGRQVTEFAIHHARAA